MEPRYITPDFQNFWSLENKYRIWLRVERAVYITQVEFGHIGSNEYQYILDNYQSIINSISVDEIVQYESEYKHDVVAFLRWLEIRTDGNSRFFHYGMTSSDLVDTALALQLREAISIISGKVSRLADALRTRARDNVDTIMMGRSHGMYAQPTTAGNFFAGHLSELVRARECLLTAMETISYGKLSGPVGSYLNASPQIEEHVMTSLGLKREPVSTQVIPRDRHLEVMFAISRVAVCIERLATNIRHLHRSEISEMKESFAVGQKGSSSMPYKQNPIVCENLCGLSRYIRSFMTAAFENVVLWQERDISHSSVERMMIPEATTYIDYMLDSSIKLIENLVVKKDDMERRVIDNPYWNGEQVMMARIMDGASRFDAHSSVQNNINPVDSQGMKESLEIITQNSEEIVNRV